MTFRILERLDEPKRPASRPNMGGRESNNSYRAAAQHRLAQAHSMDATQVPNLETSHQEVLPQHRRRPRHYRPPAQYLAR
jgi:hypothetical protein